MHCRKGRVHNGGAKAHHADVLQESGGLHPNTPACCHLVLHHMATSKYVVRSCIDIGAEHVGIMNARCTFWCVLDHDGDVCSPDAGGGVAQR